MNASLHTARRIEGNAHRAGEPALRAMAHSPRMVEDLVESRVGETGKLDFRDRLEPFHGHADRGADDERFGERRVDHPFGAVALE